MSKYNELVKKLKEIFQIDRPELDFGIYRILNAKADEINDYLENTLKKKISDALATAGNANKEELYKQLSTAIKAAEDAGFDPEDSPKVKDFRLQIVATSQGANEHENAVNCRVLAKTHSQTGVEMEALTAVQIALLTIYDMCKAVDRSMTMSNIRLIEKSGGTSGDWKADL